MTKTVAALVDAANAMDPIAPMPKSWVALRAATRAVEADPWNTDTAELRRKNPFGWRDILWFSGVLLVVGATAFFFGGTQGVKLAVLWIGWNVANTAVKIARGKA